MDAEAWDARERRHAGAAERNEFVVGDVVAHDTRNLTDGVGDPQGAIDALVRMRHGDGSGA